MTAKKDKALALKVNCEPSKDNCGASCYYQYVYFKAKKRVYSTPKVGDKVIFGTKLAKGSIKHIGIVVAIDGKKITTVEGNKSNQVKKCTYTLGAKGSAILAFLRPAYTSDVTAAEVVKIALGQVGTKETGTNHQKYSKEMDSISYYNTKKDPAGADWCAIFTDWCIYTATAKEESKSVVEKEPAKETTKKTTIKASEPAASHDTYYAKSYKITTSGKTLNMRDGAGTEYKVIAEIPNKTVVRCYGYYTGAWLFVRYETSSKIYEGFCSKVYLK